MHSGTAGNKVMVFNLPSTFNDEELRSMFSHFGEIQFVRLFRNKTTNNSLGYGSVEFVKRADAQKAIEEVDGLQLGNKKLKVSYPEPVTEEVKNATKVQVRKLPPRFIEDNVKELFGKYGKIVKIRLLRDSVTNKSRCMAFVFFERPGDAHTAVRNLNGFQPESGKNPLDVKIIETEHAPRPAHHAQVGPYSQARPITQSHGRYEQIPSYVTANKGCTSVFVYNVGELVTEHELYNIFSQFGGLAKIDIARDPRSNMCKGYAFLTFDNRASAENAIFTIDGMMYRGRQLQVRYKHG